MAESNRPDLCIKQEVSLTCAPGTSYDVRSSRGHVGGRVAGVEPRRAEALLIQKYLPPSHREVRSIQLSNLPEIGSAAGL